MLLGFVALAMAVASCRPTLTAGRAPADLPIMVFPRGTAIVGADARPRAEPALDRLRSVVDLNRSRTNIRVSPGGRSLLYVSDEDPDQQFLISDWMNPHPVPLNGARRASFVTDEFLVLRAGGQDDLVSPMALVAVDDLSHSIELPCATGIVSMNERGLVAFAPEPARYGDEQRMLLGEVRGGRFVQSHETVLPVLMLRGLELLREGRFIVVDGDDGVLICDTNGVVTDRVDGARFPQKYPGIDRFWLGAALMEVTAAGKFSEIRRIDTGLMWLSPDGRWGVYQRSGGSIFSGFTPDDAPTHYYLRSTEPQQGRYFLPDGYWFWLTP